MRMIVSISLRLAWSSKCNFFFVALYTYHVFVTSFSRVRVSNTVCVFDDVRSMTVNRTWRPSSKKRLTTSAADVSCLLFTIYLAFSFQKCGHFSGNWVSVLCNL